MSDEPIRIGLVGLDTSHAVIFSRLLNDEKGPENIAGGRVVVGFAGGSADFPLSEGRVKKFTAEVRSYGVGIVDSPEEVAEECDVLFITAVDGRKHLEYVERTARWRRPTFVDKPIALNSSDAAKIFAMARDGGFALCSASALRFADGLAENLAGDAERVGGCDVYGPLQFEATQPGYFWYGVHAAEIVNRVMGSGCREVSVFKNESCELLRCVWDDGRVATIRGIKSGHNHFGVTLHRQNGATHLDLSRGKKSYYANLMEAVMRELPHNRPAVAAEDTLEIVRMLEAANEARDLGRPVSM